MSSPTAARVNRMRDLELEHVVQGAARGDAEAAGELYRRFAARVLALCRRMLGSREAAEDATGDIFMRLQRSISTYDGSVPFEHWFLRVASHYCVDLLRRRQLEQRWFVGDPEMESLKAASSGPSPLAMAMTAETSAEVRSALDHLPANYRTALVLRYFADLSYEEIAEQLGLKRTHVATLIFRAKQDLREALQVSRGQS